MADFFSVVKALKVGPGLPEQTHEPLHVLWSIGQTNYRDGQNNNEKHS